MVWWSKPLMPVPQPCEGLPGVVKSSSEYAVAEQARYSWLTIVRPVVWSVQPIGSSEILFEGSVGSVLTFFHVEVSALSLKPTTYSSVLEVKSVLPDFQLLPMLGSPALSATPLGALNWWYLGALAPEAATPVGSIVYAVAEPV